MFPMYVGEFGAGVHCFENDKGGLQWVTIGRQMMGYRCPSLPYQALYGIVLPILQTLINH